MKQIRLFAAGLLLLAAAVAGCTGRTGKAVPAVPEVYMTRDISPAGLNAVYEALGREAKGKVAVKISTGEPGGNNFLDRKSVV